jgi:hypothetical protein
MKIKNIYSESTSFTQNELLLSVQAPLALLNCQLVVFQLNVILGLLLSNFLNWSYKSWAYRKGSLGAFTQIMNGISINGILKTTH